MARRQRQPATLPLRDPTSDYARRVVSGEIVAGKFVRLACQRHLDDLETGAARGLYFDREIAELALEFFPAMFTVTAGAKAGEPFHLLDWMTFVVGSLFGWRDRNGLRRFRHAWLETGKGQAKSPLMGALGIYMTCFNGVRRAEAYAIANDKDQAKILFSDAVALCRSPIPGMGETTLEALHNDGDPNGVIIRGVGDNAWKIEHPATGSKFLPVASSDAISGPKPVAVFGDEIHEMKTDRAIQLWKAAIDKMPGDPLMILGTNTPASDQTVGTEYSLLYQRILEGLHQDDSAFAYIARVDEQHTREYSIWDALKATQRHCTCSFAPSTQTHESIARVYANHAISDATGRSLSSGVRTTLIERSGQGTCARPATTGKTGTTKNTSLPGGSPSAGGRKKTGNVCQNTSVDGPLSRGQDTRLTLLADDFCECMAPLPMTSTSCSPSKAVDALYAIRQDRKLKSFASIIAMNEALIEASSATSATLASVCSEITSRVLSEHSDTCALRGATLTERGLSVVIPADDPFEDESCWIKALPAIGVTYPVENVRKRVQSARHMPSERLATERLFFGIPVGSSGFWIDEASWRAVQGEVDESKLKGLPCFLGMDLSSKNDLTAVSACWAHPDGKLSVKTWYWTTAQRLPVREAEDHVPYSAYAAEGHISIQSGSVIDYTFVAAEIARLASSHKVDSLTVDPSKLSDFMGACEQIGLQVWQYDGPEKSSGHGLKIVKHAQGTRVMFNDRQLCMPHSITRLTDKVLKGEITIAANKMTDVCAANAVLVMDGMGNKAFDKQRQRGRIDGMVSMAMAVGASADVKPARRSYMSAGVMFT